MQLKYNFLMMIQFANLSVAIIITNRHWNYRKKIVVEDISKVGLREIHLYVIKMQFFWLIYRIACTGKTFFRIYMAIGSTPKLKKFDFRLILREEYNQFQERVEQFYQMTQRQRNQLIKISWSSHEGTVSYATKLYVILSSIIEDIFEKAAEILNSSAVIPTPGPLAGTFMVQNLVSPMEPLVVIVNNNFKISCQAKCKRYHAYQICEHCLAVAEKESVLINFLAYHKKRNIKT